MKYKTTDTSISFIPENKMEAFRLGDTSEMEILFIRCISSRGSWNP